MNIKILLLEEVINVIINMMMNLLVKYNVLYVMKKKIGIYMMEVSLFMKENTQLMVCGYYVGKVFV